MTNHLVNSTSPYLLQHAHNPVDWHPWGEEALAKSKTENKPIFLSIGYAACHWCHVMAHESFEDAEIAAYLNDHFVSIKVDREERPDLDSIYMAATQALTRSGGWPMSVFLTPDLRPFYAGTYFPPVKRYNMPAFKDVLSGLVNAWQNEHTEVERVGDQLIQHLQQNISSNQSGASFTKNDLDQAMRSVSESYDWGYGGWGEAPKFPQPMTIEFLLRRINYSRFKEINKLPPFHALQAMARGGMYDVVGGGFSRYSTDNFWRVPHFEKMLYDNAQLGLVYLHAWQITREPFYKHIVIETLDFVAREMTHPDGGFYSSLDADSEGEEGKFYVWTKDEIRKILSDDSDFEFFIVAYGITEKGNWEGRTVLQRAMDNSTLAVRFNLDPERVNVKLADCHSKLLSSRATRIRPSTDDKILTAWNGLMLCAFAEAARFLDDKEKSLAYTSVATRSVNFLLNNLNGDTKLHRSWRDGKVTAEVFLEDYASLILGLLELYQTDFNNRWFSVAQKLADEMITRFTDPAGGFFDTPNNGENLLIRPKDIQDNATPSGNSLACSALLKLAAFTNDGTYRDLAEQSLTLVSNAALRYPTAFARWLSAADQALDNGQQIAVMFEAKVEEAEELLKVVRGEYRPNVIVAASAYPPSNDSPDLLADRLLIGRMPTAYVCEHFVCKQPVTTAKELRSQL